MHLVSNLKAEGSGPACANIFFYSENSGGAENAAENSGTNSKIFFCCMYESIVYDIRSVHRKLTSRLVTVYVFTLIAWKIAIRTAQ
jgi:hypothetical protein